MKSESINNELVTLAREARQVSQSQLATKTGVSQSKISKIEAGLLSCDSTTLQKIAEKLDFPVSFFYQSDFRIPLYFHRKRQSLPLKKQRQLHATIDIIVKNINTLLSGVEDNFNHFFWSLPIDDYDGDVKKISELVRYYWKLPRGPIDNLIQVIEKAGGIVVKLPSDTKKWDAVGVPNNPPVFFVNDNIAPDRLRFSLAHEVGHIIMHELPSPEMESEADFFAANFLLPEEDIRPFFIGKLNLSKMIDLMAMWKVSVQALIVRARNLGAISEHKYKSLYVQLSQNGMLKKQVIELQNEEPSALSELLKLYKKELNYSNTELCSLFHLNTKDFEAYYLPHRRGMSVVK